MRFFKRAVFVVFCAVADISEVGRCAKSYCEHTARSIPTLSDAVVTLIEMGRGSVCLDMQLGFFRSLIQFNNIIFLSLCTKGFNVDTLPVYAKRSQRMVITARE